MKFFLLLCLFLFSCARAPLKDPNEAMRKLAQPIALSDSLSLDSLRDAFQQNRIALLNPKLPDTLHFGSHSILRADYLRAMDELALALDSFPHFLQVLQEKFDTYEVYGDDQWGEALVTGYYDPELEARPRPEDGFSEPLYRLPTDLVKVDLPAFAEKNPALEALHKAVVEQKSRQGMLMGRLVEGKVIPYYERKEITSIARPLGNKKLEIAWVNPIDAFFLQIQGSGILHFPDGKKFRVGFAASNGAPYAAIGKFLKDVIPLQEMSMQRIRAYLSTLSADKLYEVLAQNPSYVFFEKLDGPALTFSGAPVSDGRSIATDSLFFPKGALAFLDLELPDFASPKDSAPSSWVKKSRFVFDQDIGGGIRGGGRADLYLGDGDLAGQSAGVLKRTAKLIYFIPKNH